jgi:DNA replication protein DnaC
MIIFAVLTIIQSNERFYTMHLQTVIDQLRSMRLTAMAESLMTRLKNNEADALEPSEFIALLVEDEYCARQRRKLQRMIGRANFKPDQATIENILYDQDRGFTKKDILLFTSADWIESNRNIILTGPTGSGKSYVAEAIGYRACTMGHPVWRIRYALLFEEIHTAKGTGQYLKFLAKLSKIKVLIIDDFLMNATDIKEAEMLMDIIEQKDQTGSIVVTTQYPIQSWHKRLPDPTIADAICDRMIQKSVQLNLKGDSMRKKQQNSQSK